VELKLSFKAQLKAFLTEGSALASIKPSEMQSER
jgi:hypothetical protein